MAPKIVLVTGGNTGLGFEVIKVLYHSSETYQIFLAGRDLAKAEAAAHDLNLESPGGGSSTVEAIQIDVEDDESILRAAETLQSKVGRLDVLVNNAGTSSESHGSG